MTRARAAVIPVGLLVVWIGLDILFDAQPPPAPATLIARDDVPAVAIVNPAEHRFREGVALMAADRRDEALNVFESLTVDYPQLPEPYNNLAALHASGGDYKRARVALESALNTHPSYATVHQNLGQIHAYMARAVYQQALPLGESAERETTKLALVRELFSLGAPSLAPSGMGRIARAEDGR